MTLRTRTLIAAALATASFGAFAGEITDFSNWPAVAHSQAAAAGELRWQDNQTGFTVVPGTQAAPSVGSGSKSVDEALTFA